MSSDQGSIYPARIDLNVIGEAWQLFSQQMGTWVLAALLGLVVATGVASLLGLVPIVGWALSGVPGFVMAVGGQRMALKQIRGGTINPVDVLNVGDVLGQAVVAGILTTLGTALGYVLLIIPGLVVGALWMFTMTLIADRDMPAVDAMRQSWQMVSGQVAMGVAFQLVMALVLIAGVLALGVGVLFALPVVMLSVALLYSRFVNA